MFLSLFVIPWWLKQDTHICTKIAAAIYPQGETHFLLGEIQQEPKYQYCLRWQRNWRNISFSPCVTIWGFCPLCPHLCWCSWSLKAKGYSFIWRYLIALRWGTLGEHQAWWNNCCKLQWVTGEPQPFIMVDTSCCQTFITHILHKHI